MTVSLPIIEYAKELNVNDEKLYRALVLGNLITIHQKTGIGRLSAYCGAVSAGCAAGCGIAYLYGADYECIAHTIVNSLAITSELFVMVQNLLVRQKLQLVWMLVFLDIRCI